MCFNMNAFKLSKLRRCGELGGVSGGHIYRQEPQTNRSNKLANGNRARRHRIIPASSRVMELGERLEVWAEGSYLASCRLTLGRRLSGGRGAAAGLVGNMPVRWEQARTWSKLPMSNAETDMCRWRLN